MALNTESERDGGPEAGTQPRHRTGSRQPSRLASTVSFLALVAVIVAFLAYVLPPYVGLDPSQAVIVLREGSALHYPLLIGHIATGTVAMLTLCLQVWPWLRRRHLALHRFSGRVYVFVGVLPSAVMSLAIMPLMPGWGGQIGVTMHAVLWLLTTFMGFLAARGRRYEAHRRWMLYSFALTMGIAWGLAGRIILPLVWPDIEVGYIFEVARWGGWVLNLVLVQWWLDRTSGRAP